MQQVLQNIGLARINGADWPTALADPRWGHLPVYLLHEEDDYDSPPLLLRLCTDRAETEQAAATWPLDGVPYKLWITITELPLAELADNQAAINQLVHQMVALLARLPEVVAVKVGTNGYPAFLSADRTSIVLYETGCKFYDCDIDRFIINTDPPQAGLFNRQGSIVVLPAFEDIHPFQQNLAVACQHGRYGIINRTGHWVLEPRLLNLCATTADQLYSAQNEDG